MRTITVGGLPGTGTSTLCKLLEARTGLQYTYAGQLFRAAAKERGLSLAEFGALCQQDDAVDKALDAKQVELLRGAPVLLEGRLAGWLAHQNNVPAWKVWVTCDDDERARRLAERDGGDVATQFEAARVREASEADRYKRYYGIDLGDLSPYDQVLDSTHMLPEALAEAVLTRLDVEAT